MRALPSWLRSGSSLTSLAEALPQPGEADRQLLSSEVMYLS